MEAREMNEDTGGYYFYMFYARLSEQINMNNGEKTMCSSWRRS